MAMSKKIVIRKKGKKKGAESMTGDTHLSLAGFRSTEIPDVTCIKFVFSDFRGMTSGANQAEYVYRLNSLFDPDVTGGTNQPDGFDQWKLLYTRYRVVAADVDVQFCGFTGIGLGVIVPTVASTALTDAQDAAGLRHAKSGMFTLGQGATLKLRASYRMSDMEGMSDQSVLADPELAALVGANPTKGYFLHVAAETVGATDVTEFMIKITYYTRMEAADYTLDVMHKAKKHQTRFLMAASGGPHASDYAERDRLARIKRIDDGARTLQPAEKAAESAVVVSPQPNLTTRQLLRTLSQRLSEGEDLGPSPLSTLGVD